MISNFNRQLRESFFKANMAGEFAKSWKKAEVRHAREAKGALVCARLRAHIYSEGVFCKSYNLKYKLDSSAWFCKRCGVRY